MRIALTSTGINWDSKMDPRLGRTDYIVIYDESNGQLEAHENSGSQSQAHGAGTATVQKIANLNIDIIITGNGPGGNASTGLKQLKIPVYINAGDMTVREALDAFKNGKLPLV